MDLSSFTIEELLLSAIKSEVDARDMYKQAADRMDNPFLKARLHFLADEEEKHRMYFTWLLRNKVPEAFLELPSDSVVPLPDIGCIEEDVPITILLRKAMEAETAAKAYYEEMADLFEDRKVKRTLLLLAMMEEAHHNLLSKELEAAIDDTEYEKAWDILCDLHDEYPEK